MTIQRSINVLAIARHAEQHCLACPRPANCRLPLVADSVGIVNSWTVNWAVLGDLEIPLADPRKTSSMSYLLSYLQKISIKSTSKDFFTLYSEFLVLKDSIRIVHLRRLEAAIEDFFLSHFLGCQVQLSPKVGGIHMGSRAQLTLQSGECRTYHVKTHAGGRLFSNSSAAKVVDPGELLVYKALEFMGIGCEALFFKRNYKDFYIATLDAGPSFDLFQRAIGSACSDADEVYGRHLWGSLDSIHSNPTLNSWDDVEATAQSDRVARAFLLNLASLDLISRIFRLHDLLNNPENFGFLKTDFPDQFVLKIIDFRVAGGDDLAVGDQHFEGFLAGNGLFNYTSSHKSIRFALHGRSKRERVHESLRALQQGALSKFHESIDSAFDFVLSTLQLSEVSVPCDTPMQELLHRVKMLRDVFHQNVSYFVGKLQSWHE